MLRSSLKGICSSGDVLQFRPQWSSQRLLGQRVSENCLFSQQQCQNLERQRQEGPLVRAAVQLLGLDPSRVLHYAAQLTFHGI